VAIKGGDLIHVGNQVLIDRAQTAGPGSVTINRTKIYELGNYYSLASILDTPDMTFSMESYDVSAEFEAMILNKPFTVDNGTQIVTETGNPTGGTFTITYGAQTTAAIAFDATAAAVQTELEALTNIVPGDVVVSGNPAGPYTIIFTPAYLSANVATNVTSSGASLTGGTAPSVTMGRFEGIVMADGTALDPAKNVPMDVVSSFKPGFTAANAYDVVGSVAIPYLQLETLSYKFGFADIASQSATFKGDSIYYAPVSSWIEETVGTNAANQVVTALYPAVVYHGDTVNSTVVDGVITKGTRYALSVCLASGKRLLSGADYTETVTLGVLAVTILAPVAVTDSVRLIYSSTQPAQYVQARHAPVTKFRPAAIKGRNVEIYIGGTAISNRWTSVQSVNVDWSVTLQKDEELGNANYVSQSFDTPNVVGSIDLMPRDYAELYAKICKVAGVTPGEVAGPLTTIPLELLVLLHSPDDGAVLKTIEVPDARFTLPGFSGQAGVGNKLNVTFSFESDTGLMTVYKGPKP
jgi:hypothetical protein